MIDGRAAFRAQWRQQLRQLLEVGRCGALFPDSARWLALLELLGKPGPRGKELPVGPSVFGFPSLRSLQRLHALKQVSELFWRQHRVAPRKDARAFSAAVAAVSLPPTHSLSVKLIAREPRPRFLVIWDRLLSVPVRFTLTVTQAGRGPIALDRSQQAQVTPKALRALNTLDPTSAVTFALELGQHEALRGLEVEEVVRGQLGPMISGARGGPAKASREWVDLASVCQRPEDAVLSVCLERLGGEVVRTVDADLWLAPEPKVEGRFFARERRLYGTPGTEAALRALARGRALVRCA